MSVMLGVTVNGAGQQVPVGTTVADLVRHLGRGPAGIAVACNGEVVPRSTWPAAVLVDGDQVEILTAAQGG